MKICKIWQHCPEKLKTLLMTALICTYYTHTSMKNTVTIIWQITTHTVQYSRSFLKRNLNTVHHSS